MKKVESLLPSQIWLSPTVHFNLNTSESVAGLLYGALLPNRVEVTHFLPFPSIDRQQLQHWSQNYEKGLKSHQDKQKVGWYSQGCHERVYQELQTCKNYQKYIEHSFFLLIDHNLEFPYLACRVKKSFLHRKVFKASELLQVKIKGSTSLEQSLLVLTGKNKLQIPVVSSKELSNKNQKSQKVSLANGISNKNKIMIEEQFMKHLEETLTQKEYKNKEKSRQEKEKQAEDLLNDLWG